VKPAFDRFQWGAAALGLCLLGFLGYLQRDRFLTGQNDFLQLYAGTKLVGTPELYDPAASRRVHRESVGAELESVYYSRPPFYAFLVKPLASMPYLTAYWVFEAISFAAFAVFLAMFLPACRELLLFSSLCLPLLSNFLAGQDVTLPLVFASAAIFAMRGGRDFLAGILFALCAVKPHLFVLVPLVLVIHRRWRVLAGGAVGGATLVAISFLAAGRHWPEQYLALLRNPELHPGAEHMPNLRGLVFGLTGGEHPALQWTLIAMVAALVCYIAWRTADLELALAFSIAGGLLAGYHAYLQDCLLLLLVFALVISKSKSKLLRSIIALAVLPPVFLFLLAGQPYNVAVPLMLLVFLGAGAWEARDGSPHRARAGHAAA
jgi:Glycosyltransferase family 87